MAEISIRCPNCGTEIPWTEALYFTFGGVDGVWVCGLDTYPALALALREQLIQVAFARAA